MVRIYKQLGLIFINFKQHVFPSKFKYLFDISSPITYPFVSRNDFYQQAICSNHLSIFMLNLISMSFSSRVPTLTEKVSNSFQTLLQFFV